MMEFRYLDYTVNRRTIEYIGILILIFMNGVRSQCSGSAQSLTVGYITGSFQSPGYDSGYNLNSDCSWQLDTSDSGASVLFQIRSIYVPCSGDLIQAYDGTDSTGINFSPVSDICGNTGTNRPAMIASSGNVFLRFTSDGDVDTGEKGFEVHYVTGRDYSGTGCSSRQSLTAATTEAYISSNSFPTNYGISKSCSWDITAEDSSENVVIELIYMDIENEGSCSYDYLQIQGTSTNVKLCEQDWWNPNTQYTSTGNSFTITFHADNENGRQGFLLKYTQTQASTTISTTATTTSSDQTVTDSTASGSTSGSVGCNIDTCVTPVVVCSVVGALALSGGVALAVAQAKGVVNLKTMIGKYKLGSNKIDLEKTNIEKESVNGCKVCGKYHIGTCSEKLKEPDKLLDTNENVTVQNIDTEIVSTNNTDIGDGNLYFVNEKG